MTANEQVYPNPYYFKNNQQTQTEITHTLQVKDTGAQYSSPSDSDDSSSSDLCNIWVQILKGQKI